MNTLRLSSLALLAGFVALPAAAQEVTLKVSHFLPGMALAQKAVLEPWCDDLGRASAGRIKCQFFPSMQLGGTPAQLPDLVKNGVADIVWTAPGYSTGRFPKTEALELPGVLPLGGAAQGRAIWPFFEQQLQAEYSAFKVLAMHGDGGMNIHTAKTAIKTADDLSGLKLRAPNRTIARTLTALGATPVAMPPAQMTEAISKGVVDGASAVWEVIVPTKLDEVTHFHMETPDDQPAMGATILTVLMNKDRYAALPADLRDIIDRHSGPALVSRFGQAWDGAIATARDKVKAAGHTVTQVEGAAYTAMRERALPVEQEWIADAKGKGFDGAALIAAARTAAAKSRP
ncbi:MAG: C4-dicarboxylate transporter [Betaproteobacteria bacterium HGW-Betaproteobacteria-13]|jgi:TRAP-type C4-dicarboxylate transport system substrate-binding protein|nr:MAG: C4-dicarboxylate transporter [Betaproteobacteria bacterium HGW-Betaproteobacteria-13]